MIKVDKREKRHMIGNDVVRHSLELCKTALINAPINSKHQHPPPRANPGHLNVYFARGVGNLI